MRMNKALTTIAIGFLVASFALITGCDDEQAACESMCELFAECGEGEGFDVDDCTDECVAEMQRDAEEGDEECKQAGIASTSCLGGLSCDEFEEVMHGQSDACADEMDAEEEACAPEES